MKKSIHSRTFIMLLAFLVIASLVPFLTGCGGGGSGSGGSSYYGGGGGGGTTATQTVTSCTANLTPGQTCTITGSGFGSSRDSNKSTVSFVPQNGGTKVTATTYLSWSDTTITLITPDLTPSVQYVIVVNVYTANGTTSSSSVSSTTNTTTGTAPATPPTITSQSPNPAIAGQSVTLTGTNFPTTGGWLTVNGAVVTATFTATTAAFTVPSTLTTNSTVALGGGTGGYTTWTFAISSPTSPTITGVSPSSVLLGGTLTLTGTGFGTAAGSVKVGTVNLTGLEWSATQVKGTLPATSNILTPGETYTVTLTTSTNLTATSSVIIADPTTDPVITGITPPSAIQGSAQPITIAGTKFGNNPGTLSLSIGTTTPISLPVTTWSDTSVTTTVPGTVPVGNYTLNLTTSSSRTVGYAFIVTTITTPAVTSVTASLAPGQTCTINGTAFGSARDGGSSAVTFTPIGGTAAITVTNYLNWTDTAISLVTPALVAGTQYVVVVNRVTTSGTVSSSSTPSSANTTTGAAPTTPPAIVSQSPNPAIAGQSVTLTGTSFPTSSGFILVNGTEVPATFTSTTVVFTIPAGTTTGATVLLGGGTGGSTTHSLIIQPSPTTPTISSVSPSSFNQNTATPLSIEGTNFGDTQGTSSVTIGTTLAGMTALTSVTWGSTSITGNTLARATALTNVTWGPTSITGTTPSLAAGTYYVYVTVNGVTATSKAITVGTPTTTPTISSVTPSSFNQNTATSLSIEGTNFGDTQGTSSVTIGTTLAGATALTSITWGATTITGTTPSLAAGTYYVYVTVNGVTATSKAVTVGTSTTKSGYYIYGCSSSSYLISVVRLSDNTVIKKIQPETDTYSYSLADIAITPNGQYAYVSNSKGSVYVIRISDDSVIKKITGLGTNPYEMAITPDSQYVYVVNRDSDNISVIRVSDNTVTATISLGSKPDYIAITPNGQYAYVGGDGQDGDGKIYIIDLNSNTVTKTITLSELYNTIAQIAITADGQYAYAVAGPFNANSLVTINTSDYSYTYSNKSSTYAEFIALNGNSAYISSGLQLMSGILSLNLTNSSVTNLTLSSMWPGEVAVRDDGKYFYVSMTWADYLYVINSSDYTYTRIDNAYNFYRIAITPNLSKFKRLR
ncbi:MAG: IPT/TIG domain-containing protein [Vulcanimicrobiota bacterium]